jgi:phospholipase C
MSASAGAKSQRVEIEVDDAVKALRKIDHIVVLMMENRSYDQMLGYLTLRGRRPELDGLLPEMANTYHDTTGKFPQYDGLSFRVHELLDTRMTKSQDPPHDGASVDNQLKNRNGGFVQAYMDERGGPAEVHPADVMGFHTGKHLPVYDHLTEKFCVCDRWFSSVGGATFPNRLYAMAGRADGSRDNANPPIYCLHSFVRHLDGVKGVSWMTFVHDLTPILWAVDNNYSVHHLLDEHVAWFDGHFRPPHLGDTFLQRAAAGKLPSVSWIDPSFADLRTGLMRLISPPSNDDHPPSDVSLGQALVLKIYDALASSPNWSRTLFVITYDEHGGFYDHVPPPRNPPDDHPKVFSRYGVRVPAIVVSPLIGRRSFSHEVFDHTSIIKTILLRFARKGNTIPNMGKRVSNAQHLGVLLTQSKPRPPETPELYRPLAARIDANRKDATHEHMTLGANARAAAKTQLTDLQRDYLKIQKEFAKELHKVAPDKLTKFF